MAGSGEPAFLYRDAAENERRFRAAAVTGAGGHIEPRVGLGWWSRAVVEVVRRPSLWPTAVGQAFRLARPGWGRRAPYLPLPDREYVRFRMQTAYGSDGRPAPEDLVAYLRWCREFRTG